LPAGKAKNLKKFRLIGFPVFFRLIKTDYKNCIPITIILTVEAEGEKLMFTNSTFRYKVIEFAKQENRTLARTMPEKIKKYTDAVGLGQGADYCVAFVYWCYEQAASTLGVSYNPMPKTGSSGELYRFAKTHNLFVEQPEIGDIYIRSDKGHTGLIREPNPNFAKKKTKTIEGNTYILKNIDEDDDREKVWGVHERDKDLKKAYFIRL
jgi:hypothetical protein